MVEDFILFARQAFVRGGAIGLVLAALGPSRYADSFGCSVVSIGDLNSDGHSEVAVSDPLFVSADGKGRCGRVWIVDPQTKQVLKTFDGRGEGDLFGVSMIAPGDLDGDDVPDLIVGTTCQGVDEAGRPESIPTPVSGIGGAYVSAISIGRGSPLYVVPVSRGGLQNIWDAAYPFPSLAALGDCNQDGVADFVIGSPYDSSSGRVHCGSVRIYSGVDGKPIKGVFGDSPHAHLGGRVIQAEGLGGERGNGILVSGGGIRCTEVTSINNPAFVWGLARGSLNRIVTVNPKDSDYSGAFGKTLCGLSDLNEDGFPEIAIGGSARGKTPLFRYSGADGSLLGKWRQRNGRFGLEMISLGDVNGDGFSDLGLSNVGDVSVPIQTLLVIVSGASDEILGEVSISEDQFPFSGVSLSVYKKDSKGVVAELLIGTASYRAPADWPGVVYVIDLSERKVVTSFSRSNLVARDAK